MLIKEVRKFSCFKEVSELINEHISRKKKHTETLALIARIYKEKIEELCYFKDEIFSLFEAYVYSGKYNPDSFKEIESIDDIKIPKVKFAKDYNVIEINDRSAIIETTVEIYYQIEFTYNDYEGAYYEKEEDEWYFLEQETDVVDKNKNHINKKLTEASRIQSSRQKTGRTDYQCVFCLKLINLPLKL